MYWGNRLIKFLIGMTALTGETITQKYFDTQSATLREAINHELQKTQKQSTVILEKEIQSFNDMFNEKWKRSNQVKKIKLEVPNVENYNDRCKNPENCGKGRPSEFVKSSSKRRKFIHLRI